jgi:photosystem II stability/assembly factor-like uncharacterized protein
MAISKTDEVIVVGSGVNIKVGKNQGTSWSTKSGPWGGVNVFAVDIFPTDPNYIAVGTNINGAYLSKDGGNTWARILSKTKMDPFISSKALSSLGYDRYYATIKSIKFDPQDKNTIYAAHSPGSYAGLGILYTTDGGSTWDVFTDPTVGLGSITTIDINQNGSKFIAGARELMLGQ